MTVKVKIVLAIINLACLLVTLIFPNDMTPFAVMIAIIPLVTWAFDTYENEPQQGQGGLLVYISVVSVLAVVCVIIGICTNVIMVDGEGTILAELNKSFDHYEICVKNGAFLFSGERIDYALVAGVEFIIVLFLSLTDIIASRGRNKTQITRDIFDPSKPISVYIENEIGHIR